MLVEHQYEALGEDESMQSEYDYEDVVVESEAYSEWPNLAGRRENYTTALPHTPASPHAHREKSQGTTIKQTRFTCSILRVYYTECHTKRFTGLTLHHYQLSNNNVDIYSQHL